MNDSEVESRVLACDLESPLTRVVTASDFEQAINWCSQNPSNRRAVFNSLEENPRLRCYSMDGGDELLVAETFMLAVWKLMPYELYIDSDHWRMTKERKDLHTGLIVRCQDCNANQHLDMHHRCYKHIGEERVSCIGRMCAGCHRRVSPTGFHKWRTLSKDAK